MGTPANLEALAALGVTCDAGPTDVVIALEGRESALDGAERELARAARARPTGRVAELAALARRRHAPLADANVALISIPGEYATLEAHRALTAGLHVFLFSDHVSEADEVELKRRGAELGLLVMGPGCGTAMLGEVGLGFANVVRSGSVGHRRRRRHRRPGGREPARRRRGRRLADRRRRRARPVERGRRDHVRRGDADARRRRRHRDAAAGLQAARARGRRSGSARSTSAASAWSRRSSAGTAATRRSRSTRRSTRARSRPPAHSRPTSPSSRPRSTRKRTAGGCSASTPGGSLAHEAVTILEPALGAIGGNAGHGDSDGHAIFDLGEEEYTQGRPHPMVDLEVRLGMLARRGARRRRLRAARRRDRPRLARRPGRRARAALRAARATACR